MIRVERMEPDVQLPHRAHDFDAAFDVHSNEDGVVPFHGWRIFHTGLKISAPPGYVTFVLPRSGMALKHGITVLNSPGLVDSGYRGELMVNLVNHHDRPYTVKKGDRIAQLLVVKFMEAAIVEVDSIDEALDARGAGGFGSTGR